MLRAIALIAVAAGPAGAAPLGLGRAALPEEIAAWNIDVRPDGLGLPAGSGDVATGEQLWIERCSTCHGDFGEAVGRWPQIAGGEGTLAKQDPVKTPGSYWPYASTLVDYVHRAMPYGNAQSLTADETYALVAYILDLNYIVEDDFVLSPETFGEVQMPNVDGFFPDDRPAVELSKFTEPACMENCKASVEITARAAVIDVTPVLPAGATGIEGESASGAAPAVSGSAGGSETAQSATQGEAVPAGQTSDAGVNMATDGAGPAASGETAPDPALVDAGEKVFRKCKACHQIGEGAKNRVGPRLTGVVGRTVGGVDNFAYSKALTDAGAGGMVWNHETLAGFLEAPKQYLSGTKMSFAGLKSEDDIAAVIAYLDADGG